MLLKPFHVLDCDPDLQNTISTGIVAFLRTQTDLFEDLDSRSLWNKLDTLALIQAVPDLAKYFQTFGLKLKEVAVTVCNNNKNAGLHIDELPVVAKINFPIMNTQHSRNLWYSVPDELISTVTPIVNEFGSSFYNLGNIDLAQCKKIGDLEITKPTVFNSQLPHMIDMSGCRVFPRLVLTCMFLMNL